MGIKKNVTIIGCDGPNCHTILENEEAPDGWIRIEFAKHGRWDATTTFVFHSEKCVQQWAEQRRRYLAANQPAPVLAPPAPPPTPEPPAPATDPVTTSSGDLLRTMQSLGFRRTLAGSQAYKVTMQEADRKKLRVLEMFRMDPHAEWPKSDVADLLSLAPHDVNKYVDELVSVGVLRIAHRGANNRWDVRTFALAQG